MSPSPSSPIVDPAAHCTLPPSDRDARLAWIRSEVLVHALSRERLPDGLAFELRDVPELASTLDRLVALERECCGGLAIVHLPSGTGRRRLEIRGVDPDAAILAGLAPDGCCPNG